MGKLKLKKSKQPFVKEVFELYEEGKSYNKIATMLDKRQVPTQKGGKWQAQHIKQMVNNETYTGINVYNGRKEKNGIKQKDVFPRIISRQLWNNVHKALKGA
jgi:site-specific DNA recombinase